MKYKLVADTPAEQQALDSGNVALPVFDTLLPVIQARAIMAGVHLGVFEAIGHEARTTDEVAQSVAADSECVELLLRVLACAGYVAREGNGYRLTEVSLGAFVGDGHARLSGLAEWAYYQWAWVERLEEVVKSGAGVDAHGSLKTPEDWAVGQKAMLEVSRMWAPPLAPLVPVNEGARRMLDIGGSHGLYGAMICREHPPMCSEVLDLPDAVEHARRLAHLEGIDDVVTFREGNALKDDLGGRFDVVFVGNLVHHFTLAQNQDLFQRVKDAMTPDGTVAIWDFRVPAAGQERELVGDGFALFFRITSTSKCFTTADYAGWLKAAGFSDVRSQIPEFAPAFVLVTGRAP